MFPILFHVGPFALRTYGALVALAFMSSVGLLRWLGAGRRLPDAFLLDLSTVLVGAGLLGARIFYVALNWSYFHTHILEIFKVWEGGLVFYGGFLAAAVAGVSYIHHRGMPIAEVADILAPALALGQAIGRWGCFAAGCCYGKPTEIPWAVHFHHPEALAPLGIGLHPTQIYESFGDLILALFLTLLVRSAKLKPGVIFWLYVLLYAVLRYSVELFRGDDRGVIMAGLFPSQWIAAAAFLVAGTALILPLAGNKHGHS